MNGDKTALRQSCENGFSNPEQPLPIERIIEYYQEAGMDYKHWSKRFNMHYGYYRWGINPFNRERMLEQMNLEGVNRLRLNSTDPAFLIDLGCGVGATARCIAKNYSNSIIKGVTIVPWQIEKALELNAKEKLHKQIEILHANYTALPFEDCMADGVWAIDSICYAEGANKENVIGEMARVLKKGGRFVVADCFIKQPEKQFNALIRKCYTTCCKNWAFREMATLEYFVATLKEHGFIDIMVEDISWQIAPSVAHAPFAVFTFILKKLLAGERLKQESINNLKASLLSVVLGLNRSKISYCLISGTRG